MEKQMMEEIRNAIRNTTSFRNEVKILRDNGFTIDETELAFFLENYYTICYNEKK